MTVTLYAQLRKKHARAKLKSKGICVSCKKAKVAKGSIYCAECFTRND